MIYLYSARASEGRVPMLSLRRPWPHREEGMGMPRGHWQGLGGSGGGGGVRSI